MVVICARELVFQRSESQNIKSNWSYMQQFFSNDGALYLDDIHLI